MAETQDIQKSQALTRICDLFTRAYIQPNTAQTYGRALQHYLEWLNGLSPFDGSPEEQMEKALQYREFVIGNFGLSTQATYLSAVKSFHRLAKGIGITPVNVWELVKIPKPPSESTTQVASPDQLERAYRSAEKLGPRQLLVFRLLYEAALRREEVAGLPVSCLCHSAVNGYYLQVTGKGEKTGTIGITDDLAHAIQQEILQHPDSPWLFPGYKGTHIAPRHVNRIIDAIDPEMHPHQLRHTHATEAIEGGEDITIVAETLRHSSIDTTRRYLHRRDAIVKSTARKVGRKKEA